MNKLIKRSLQKIAEAAGFRLIPEWMMPNIAQSERLRKIFLDLDIREVVDVGANAGQFRDFIRNEIGFLGKIYSFEPDPAMASELTRRAAADPAWTVFPFALGAEEGELTLNVMQNSVYNSFLTPNTSDTNSHASSNTIVKTVKVNVKTLDSMAEIFSNLKKCYVKIDTQGFDEQVLSGGKYVLSTVPAIQAEISVKKIYNNMLDMWESIAEFSKMGFDIADLFIVSTDGAHRAVEFDCVMVRRSDA